MLKQTEAIVNIVKTTLGARYDPTAPCKQLLTDDEKAFIKAKLVDDILNEKVECNKDITDIKAITRYVASAISSCLSRNKALNGGSNHAKLIKQEIEIDMSKLPDSLKKLVNNEEHMGALSD